MEKRYRHKKGTLEYTLAIETANLSDYFGALKDSKVIGEIEKDSRRIREAASIRI